MSARTRNSYRVALASFGNWLRRSGLVGENPFSHLPTACVRSDRRHVRRALTPAEAGRLLAVARLRSLAERGREIIKLASKPGHRRQRTNWTYAPLSFGDLSAACARARGRLDADAVAELEAEGREWELVYRTLLGSGIRKGELAQVTVGDVDLEAVPPAIRLRAETEKNRQGNTLPLPADLAADLRVFLADRLAKIQAEARRTIIRGQQAPIPNALPAGMPLLNLPMGLVKIFDRDLAVAGIEKVDARGRVLDVHALRTSFGTGLSAAGAPLRTAQAAMRHSDPKLTANVYTDPALLDVGGAVASLPKIPELSLAPAGESAQKTGTNDLGESSLIQDSTNALDHSEYCASGCAFLCLESGKNPDNAGNEPLRLAVEAESYNSMLANEKALQADSLQGLDSGERDGTRTRNHQIDSLVR